MLKCLTSLTVCVLAATSCGFIGEGDGSEAQVEILNQDAGAADAVDPTDEADSAQDPVPSADGADNTDADSTADNGADNNTDSNTETEVDATTAAGSGAGTILETLDGAVVIVDGDGRVSADPSELEMLWGYLTIDDVYATDRYDERSPSPDAKFVAIDYQFLIAEDGGRFVEEAYRLIANGESYSPLAAPDAYPFVGKVVNNALLFEVPEAAQSFELRAGAPDDSIDGFLTTYSFNLKAGGAEVQIAPSADEVELTTTDIVLTSDQDVISVYPSAPSGTAGQLLVDKARTTTQIDGVAAGPDHKYLIVDYQLFGLGWGNTSGSAFRVKAADEWYSSIVDEAGIIDHADVINDAVVFLVPRNATEFVFEGGMPEQWEEGQRATYAFSFDGVSASESDDAVADVGDIEAEASTIVLASDDNRMAPYPTPSAPATAKLTVNSARTTAKMGPEGAEPGWKFLAIELQLEIGGYGNLSHRAFRVVANGEKYSPVEEFSDIVDAGDIYNDTAIFLVPSSATEFTLIGGVLEREPGATTTRYDIGF